MVLQQLDKGLLTITMNRPDRRNALNPDMTRGLVDAARDGQDVTVGVGAELGTTFFQHELVIPSGETTEVRTEWTVADAWEGDAASGTYHLTFQGQTTIRPVDLTIVIHVPPGMHVSRLSENAVEADDAIVWEGTAGNRVDVEVGFQAPLPARWWHELSGLLD